MIISIDELWNSKNPEVWEKVLLRYWEFVKPSNTALEQSMGKLNVNHLEQLDARGWYEFLKNKYFRWKYTANNRYATTTASLLRYQNENALEELYNIKLRLISLDPSDIAYGLKTAQEIRGLGCAGASGLLSLLYPSSFGTVDQFAVKALREVGGLSEANVLHRMKENSLTTKDGVILIQIMQRKATQLNQLFRTAEWTPRKIDMVLWTYGRESESPKIGASVQNTTTSFKPEKTASHRNQTHEFPVTNHDMITSAIENFRGKVLSTSEIQKIVIMAFPHFSIGSLLPNDHALGNKSSCSCAGTDRRIFNRIEAGKYLVL